MVYIERKLKAGRQCIVRCQNILERKDHEEGRCSLTIAALCLALVENDPASVQDSFGLLKLNVLRALWPLNPAI